jgi:hypothetical protein
MRVGVGFCDNTDSATAGRQAASDALKQAGRSDPCDLVLLFATARHDARILRDAVASVVGNAHIVGGGAVGTITNDRFGYAGDQIAMACLWLDGARCDILNEGGLLEGEEAVGRRLGKRLAEMNTTPQSPVMLFYDAIDRTGGGVRMVMATWILAGIEQELGFLPDLTGAGMMGDYACSPTRQWIGEEVGEHHATVLTFSGDVRVDNVIMHGCRPATRYYTVTKADKQVILEINGRPALQFLDDLLGSAIPSESYPFFLLLGVNRGEKWGKFDENDYASRLCLAIDKEHSGLVMFEPDMVEGTEFQIMYRSLDLDYMKPRIEELFDRLGDREPVFALYIDCAGRAAGYGGIDLEDAVMVQNTVANRVPILGIYTGVEIAKIGGHPRGLDWTGVFCLFSVPKERKTS